MRPLLKKLGVAKSDEQAPEGWEDALTSEEFFEKSKKMLRRKFDEEVKYDKIDVLITKEYFSIYENSVEYVWGL